MFGERAAWSPGRREEGEEGDSLPTSETAWEAAADPRQLTVLLTYSRSDHSLSVLPRRTRVCLSLSSHIGTFSTCDTRLSPESGWASLCLKDHQHLTPLFPSDSGSGRCHQLKLSFVAAAPGTSETVLPAWNKGPVKTLPITVLCHPLLPLDIVAAYKEKSFYLI